MRFFRNLVLMAAVNIGIIITLSLVLNLLGVTPYLSANGIDYGALFSFCLVWGMGGALLSLLISKWMAKMALGVQTVPEDTSDPDLRRLYSIVRRAAERAGLPKTPEVGIYNSPELNAFATGPSARSALVAVSSGLLNSMNENEVEGVVGHEVAHIANGDMVTMTLLQGVVNAMVMFLARIVAQVVSSSGDSRERSRGWTYYLTVTLFEMVFGILGVMITAWFSRRREFRADAGGSQFMGREKMVAALEALRDRNRVVDDRAPQLAAFKIFGGRGQGLRSLFMTHPPLEERLAALRSGRSGDLARSDF